MKRRRRQAGFTLLEVIVATLLMGLAVAGLMGAMTQSARNAARVVNHDRAALLAKRKMDELLSMSTWPRNVVMQGQFDEAQVGVPAGWRARVTFPERPPNAFPGVPVLQRVELEIWWQEGEQRRSMPLSAYRRATLVNEDMQYLPPAPPPGSVPPPVLP